jgi:DNA-binding response OmpR family regulator
MPGVDLSIGRRILLVDDEPDNNRIFTIVLQDNGYDVDAFEDPKLALAVFKPNYYDLVILDLRMPGIPGDELYQRLRKIDDKFKLCIMSAYGSEHYKTLFSPTDRICFMRKPITINGLVKNVDEIMMHAN